MRIVGLFRVSTEKQENEGASLDAQERRFREIAATNSWTVVQEFRGHESAAKAATERAVLQRALTCIRDQDVDALWVYEQSRLTRGDELECALLVRELRERKVVVYVGTEARDLSSIDQRMVFRIQSAVDEAEHARIRERMQRGRREKAKQGKRTGGSPPYGYRNPAAGDPRRGILQVDAEQAVTVRRIFRAVGAGVPIRRLSRELTSEGIPAPRSHAWGKTTIRRILDNAAYLGTAFYGVWNAGKLDLLNPDAIIVDGAHEPIIDRETWTAAHGAVRGNSNGRPGMLSGLLLVNGQRTQIDSADGQSFYRPANRGKGAWLPVNSVNPIAWSAFLGLVRDPIRFRKLVQASERARSGVSAADHATAMAGQRARLAARLERLIEMRADGEITKADFASRSDQTRRALRVAEENIAAAQRQSEVETPGSLDRLVEAARALSSSTALSVEDRRRAIASLAAAVHVNAVAREAQPRNAGGQFRAASTPKWQAQEMFFELLPSPAPVPAFFGCGPRRVRILLQVVANGRVIAPRLADRSGLDLQAVG